MNCSLTEKQQDQFYIKVYKDLSEIIKNDETFLLEDYIQSVHDLVFDATKDDVLGLSYAQLTPEYIQLAISVDKELRKGLRSKGLNLEKLADIIDEFDDIDRVKNFLVPQLDAEGLENRSNEVVEAGLIGTQEVTQEEYTDFIEKGDVTKSRLTFIANKIKNNQELSLKEKAIFQDKTSEINQILKDEVVNEFGFKAPTAQTTTGQEGTRDDYNVKDNDPVKVLRYNLQRQILNEIFRNGLANANSLGYYLKAIRAIDVSDSSLPAEDVIWKSKKENKKKIENGVYWTLTNQYGEEILFEQDGEVVKESVNGTPVIFTMRQLKERLGQLSLTNKYGVQTPKELATKVYGPKYTQEELNKIEKIRREELEKLSKLREEALKGNSVIVSITGGSLGQYSIGYTPIKEIPTNNFKSSSFIPYVAEETSDGKSIGWLYFNDNNNVPINIDRSKLTDEDIHNIASMITMPLNLTDQQKFDYLSNIYLGSKSTISFYSRKNKITFEVGGKKLDNFNSPEEAYDTAVKLLTDKRNKGQKQGRYNYKTEKIGSIIKLYRVDDSNNVTSISIPYNDYIRDNALQLKLN